jgi:hypothetical protein
MRLTWGKQRMGFMMSLVTMVVGAMQMSSAGTSKPNSFNVGNLR